MDLATQLRNHRIQLETKVDGFAGEQGVEMPVYLLMRTIRLLKQAEAR